MAVKVKICMREQCVKRRTLWTTSIPEEILSMIFLFAVFPCDSLDDTRTRDIISQVCRQWRRIVASSSELWAHVFFSLDDPWIPAPGIQGPQFVDNRPGLRCVDYSLRRAGNRLLDITVFPCEVGDIHIRRERELHRLRKLLSRIRPHIRRIRSLRITVADPRVATELATELQGWDEMPNLTELCLTCKDPYNLGPLGDYAFGAISPPTAPATSLMPAPALKTLSLSVTNFFNLEMLEGMESLESLTLTEYTNRMEERVDIRMLLHRLAKLPSLKELKLDGLYTYDPMPVQLFFAAVDAPAGFATLPSLETLDVRDLSGSFLHLLFETLSAPLLHTLTVTKLDYSLKATDTFMVIKNGLDRFPNLRNFGIIDSCWTVWQNILQYLTWVKKMTVRGINKCRCRVRPHTAPYDNMNVYPMFELPWLMNRREVYFCPKLEDLTMEVHGEYHCRMVQSMLTGRELKSRNPRRRNKPTRILKLKVTDCECHEHLPDHHRDAFAKSVDEFYGPQKCTKANCSRRPCEACWHYDSRIMNDYR
ncbi:hypothetical protein BXZ70DRAFT_2745 [Cristinia sonorae]|uniref:F-box domain-containing protein n=1 Tax=Cristinia sonorae TaxID=1940300 RepID=A0A8K0XUU1_9AGAR|nr:hypothetical protein BXZ70DRAFT_2745 [Cristinia sonorae]